MATVQVEGIEYHVTENLGYQGGVYAKAVAIGDNRERIAVSDRRAGPYRWHVIPIVPRSRMVGQGE